MRVVLGWVLGLGVDESYEVVMARVPALSYFDHPPLSFWIAGATARLLGTEQRTVMRLPFIMLFALSSWLMFRLTARLYGERAGYLAVLLLNLSPVFSLSTGGWVLPDGPLACAMLAAAMCLSRAVIENASPRWWLAAGAATGLALLSKYHGVFLILGTLLFVITRREARHWLRRPEPYLAVAIALLIAMPVFVWNVEHDFASIRFQAGRATSHGIHFVALAKNIAGQLAYLLPWIGVPLVWQLARGLRAGPADAPRWLLTCLAVWPIGFFTLVSLGGSPGLPHWPAPGYLFLFPLLGDAAARYEARGTHERMLMTRALVTCAAVFVALTLAAASAVATGWPVRVAPSLFQHGDPTLEAVDWRELRPALDRDSLLRDDFPIITTHWIDAAKAGYAVGPRHQIFCFCADPRGFGQMFPTTDGVGPAAILLLPAARSNVVGQYRSYFVSLLPAARVPIRRMGQVILEIDLYRGQLAGHRP